MRCSCPECGTYMTHSEGLEMGCVCPQCQTRCKMCLGTNSVISRDELRKRAAEYIRKDGETGREDEYQ